MSQETVVALLVGVVTYYAVAWMLFLAAASCVVYHKADKPWWTALIPIYNVFVFLDMVGRPWWWFLLLVIASPFVITNVVFAIILSIDLAQVFDRGIAFGLGLAFLTPFFLPLLAFGESEYVGHVTR